MEFNENVGQFMWTDPDMTVGQDQNTKKWWHRTEDDGMAGPYDTEKEAERNFNAYCVWINQRQTIP